MTWPPTAPLKNLERRAELLRALRNFFDTRGFIEVQTPILSADTVIDRYVDPIAVEDETFPVTAHGTRTRYLQTSPEFAMKRLLAAGMESIYQIGPVFRRGDRGRLHNVEFTMLEWYRRDEEYHPAMNFLADLVTTITSELQSAIAVPHELQSAIADTSKIKIRPYAEVFQTRLGLDPHRSTPRQLQTLADAHRISYPPSYASDSTPPDDWLDLLFDVCVQPHLAADIVYDYPGTRPQLAVSRRTGDNVTIAERFELFLNGIEIANGYHELLDPGELHSRFEITNREREADARRALPLESGLWHAMRAGLPPCCGVALGVDRLLMALLGLESIDAVLTFPIENA